MIILWRRLFFLIFGIIPFVLHGGGYKNDEDVMEKDVAQNVKHVEISGRYINSYSTGIIIEYVEEDCTPDGSSYTVKIGIRGGTEPYFVNGEELVGTTFTSLSMATGAYYHFSITDSGSNDEIIIEGAQYCNCSNRVGDLNALSDTLCEGDNYTFDYMKNPITPNGFKEVFVLHDGTPFNLGTIFLVSESMTIDFTNNIPLDRNLLLTPVSGIWLGSQVDYNDNCTQLGNSIQLRWNSNAKVILSIPLQTICEGESFLYSVKIIHKFYPVNINISGPNYNEDLVITSSANYTKEVFDAQSGTFTVTILDDICVFVTSQLSFDIVTENCGCKVYSFSAIDTVCNSNSSIDLTKWVNENAPGNWSLESSNSNPKPIITNGVLDFGFAGSGMNTLNFIPTSMDACDSIYKFNIYIEDFQPLTLKQENFYRCFQSEDNIDLNLNLDHQNVEGSWISINSLNQDHFSEGIVYPNSLVSGQYTFEFVRKEIQSRCLYDPLIVSLTVHAPLDYKVNAIDPKCLGEEGLIGIDFPNGTDQLSKVELDGNEIQHPYQEFFFSGTHKVKITDVNQCQYTEDVLLVDPEALDYIITSTNPDCYDENGNLAIEILDGPIDLNGITLDGQNLPFPFTQELSSGIYNVVITDENLCKYFEQVELKDPDELYVELSSQITKSIEGNIANVETVSNGENLNYAWYRNGELVVNESGDFLSLFINGDTEIKVVITNENGCTAEDLIFLAFSDNGVEVTLPNVFRPGSKNGNDFFAIPQFDAIDEVRAFSIYDRWGQNVFYVENLDPKVDVVGWDGTSNGQYCMQGVYMYYIQYIDSYGQVIELTGDLTIIR